MVFYQLCVHMVGAEALLAPFVCVLIGCLLVMCAYGWRIGNFGTFVYVIIGWLLIIRAYGWRRGILGTFVQLVQAVNATLRQPPALSAGDESALLTMLRPFLSIARRTLEMVGDTQVRGMENCKRHGRAKITITRFSFSFLKHCLSFSFLRHRLSFSFFERCRSFSFLNNCLIFSFRNIFYPSAVTNHCSPEGATAATLVCRRIAVIWRSPRDAESGTYGPGAGWNRSRFCTGTADP